MNIKSTITLAVALTALCFTGCRNANGTSDSSDVLVAVGKSTLVKGDLSSAMPGGLNEEDSVKFARAYIRNWINAQLVSEIAASEIDMTEIEKMVDQYRNELIMWEYSRRMYDSHKQIDMPEDSIRSYYDSHPDEFVLSRPMVQGLYLKVEDNSPDLPTLRKAYLSRNSEDLDKIEKSGISGGIHYDYFLDKWIDWDQIESLIPYEFGASPDAFLRIKRNLDFSKGGFTYLLNISDVRFTGQRMPYEAARDYIIDRLTFHDKRAYDLMLKEKLYRNAIDEGKIRLNCNLED